MHQSHRAAKSGPLRHGEERDFLADVTEISDDKNASFRAAEIRPKLCLRVA